MCAPLFATQHTSAWGNNQGQTRRSAPTHAMRQLQSQLFKVLNGLLLFSIQLFRHFNANSHIQISSWGVPVARDAKALEADLAAAGGSGRHFDAFGFIQCLYRGGSTQAGRC